MWIELCFDTDKDFCAQTYTILYDNFQIIIEKGDLRHAHNLHVHSQSAEKRYKRAYAAVLNFLSELSWLFQSKIEIFKLNLVVHSSAKTKGWIELTKYNRELNTIDLSCYTQIAYNTDQKFALGFYREGISSNSHFYSFLNFYKIITISNSKRKSIDWINENKGSIKNSRNVLFDLENNKKESDIGLYLYSSGRCAVSHAKDDPKKPIVDPNDYEHNARILYELPLIKELAEISMKKQLKILTKKQMFQEYSTRIKERIRGVNGCRTK